MATDFQGQRFCQDCSKMLYGEEDPDERVLYYRCSCGYSERAAPGNEYENCVFRTDLEAKASQLIINEDIVSDPTLAKRFIDKCMNKLRTCNGKEVVTFYHITQERFDLIYVCTKCRHAWRMIGTDSKYDIQDDTDEDPELGQIAV